MHQTFCWGMALGACDCQHEGGASVLEYLVKVESLDKTAQVSWLDLSKLVEKVEHCAG